MNSYKFVASTNISKYETEVSFNSNDQKNIVNSNLVKNMKHDKIFMRKNERLSLLKRIFKNNFSKNLFIWTILVIFSSLILLFAFYIIKNRKLNTDSPESVLKVEIISSYNHEPESILKNRIEKSKVSLILRGFYLHLIIFFKKNFAFNQNFPKEDDHVSINDYRMKRIFLANDSIVCNDGSSAG
jgi:hypothetical protein